MLDLWILVMSFMRCCFLLLFFKLSLCIVVMMLSFVVVKLGSCLALGSGTDWKRCTISWSFGGRSSMG